MDFNATIDLIIKDLDEARNIIDDLKKYPGVPVLQVELAKAKCKSAGEVIALLKELSDNVPVEEKTTFKPQQKQKPHSDEEKNVNASSDSLNPPIANKEIEIPVIEKKETDQKPKKGSESEIFADKFSHMSSRINEQLGNRNGEDDVSEILKSKPLSNLPDAIGVNDKFLFIREIFDGDEKAYTDAILQLDKSKNIADAEALIVSYTGSNDNDKAVKQLFDLVKRKFLSNE